MAESPAGRSSAGALWPLVAIVVIAAFLVWLALTSEPSVVATPVETPNDTAPGGEASANSTVVVQPADFESNGQQYVGQQIELPNVPVAQVMGSQIIWVELPGGTPFLVKLNSAPSPNVRQQTRVTVVGRVLEKTDSVLNSWQQSGVFENEGHRQQAEYGGMFIEATSIRPAASQ